MAKEQQSVGGGADEQPATPYWGGLIAFTVAVLMVSWVLSLGGGPGWPWEPLRFALACAVFVAVATWRPRWAAIVVAVWAVIACPFAIGPGDYTDSSGDYVATAVPLGPPGTGVPSGPFRVDLGPVPVGEAWFTTPEKHYINGEMGDPSEDLVAWSIAWLPWPHVDRAKVGALNGNGTWQKPVELYRDGHPLVLTARRFLSTRFVFESRQFGLGWSRSWLSWLGWVLIVAAASRRVWQARAKPEPRRPRTW